MLIVRYVPSCLERRNGALSAYRWDPVKEHVVKLAKYRSYAITRHANLTTTYSIAILYGWKGLEANSWRVG